MSSVNELSRNSMEPFAPVEDCLVNAKNLSRLFKEPSVILSSNLDPPGVHPNNCCPINIGHPSLVLVRGDPLKAVASRISMLATKMKSTSISNYVTCFIRHILMF